MAYVPGLTVTEEAIVRKDRILPIRGEVLVSVGDEVSHETVIARCTLPGEAYMVDVAGVLGIPMDDTEHYTKMKVGEKVEKDEPIAESSALFGLFKTTCKAPCTGTCEMISNVTGKVIFRGEPRNVEIKAYIPGIIVDVNPNLGATIETPAVFIQGIFGIGGEINGELQVISDSPRDLLTDEHIKAEHTGKIIVGGSRVTVEALKKAVEIGVKGIIVGSILTRDLLGFTGSEIGVAITGHEEFGLTLILTEGFGDIQMSEKAFTILKRYSGSLASINGATQIRAGVIRPELIIQRTDIEPAELSVIDEAKSEGLKLGTYIRIINEPYFGALGKVASLPVEPQLVESGSFVRVLEAELENGKTVMIPRANVEIIE